MSGLDQQGSASGLVRKFPEPERFASALLGGQFDCLPVHGHPFAATLRVLRVGDMVVQQVDTSAHVVRGGIDRSIGVLMLNLEQTRHPARLNGREVGATEAVMATGGAEIAGHNPQQLSWAAIALPLTMLEELAELGAPPLSIPATVSQLTLPPEQLARVVGALSAAGRLAQGLPPELASPQCAVGLGMSLRDEVTVALTAAGEVLPRPRAVGEALRLVRKAEAFMEAQITRPVYTEELCAALCVSARRLHDAFRAALGMSPHVYLKSRRLTLVHRALLTFRGSPELVKSVALDHGFWHLGHFARDYRALFGQLPSETLASAESESGHQKGFEPTALATA